MAEDDNPAVPWLVVMGLRREIDASGHSQAALCRLMGISQKHLSQIVTGKVPVSTQIAVRLEKVLRGVDAEQLMALQAIEAVREERQRWLERPGHDSRPKLEDLMYDQAAE